MAHKKRTERKLASLLTPDIASYFTDGEIKPEIFFIGEEKSRKIWKSVEEKFLMEWVEKFPCTRPFAWWSWTAPRWTRRFPGWYFDGKLPEPRRRLGGVGTEDFEVLNIVPDFQKGLPTGWVSKFDEEYYNGRAKDIHGNIIPTRYKEGDFSGKAIDPNDPPQYESEAAYLKRLGFLTKEEEKFLSRNPGLLEPEIVED